MKIQPILTEKSMNEAKNGKYSFWVPLALSKHQIRELISTAFSVHVKGVRTQRTAGGTRTTLARKKISVMPKKKAMVTLAAKETIDLFETEKKKK